MYIQEKCQNKLSINKLAKNVYKDSHCKYRCHTGLCQQCPETNHRVLEFARMATSIAMFLEKWLDWCLACKEKNR
jgi:hypothetical protein